MLDTGRLPLTGDALAWFRQGLSYAASGAHESAIGYYNKVLQARSEFWEAWYERGLSLESLGFYSEAIASFDQAIKAHPREEAEVEIWHERGNALQYGLGDYQAALACYDRCLQINDAHALAWHHRGNALLYGLNQPEAAIASYTRALESAPGNYLTWRNRGNALMELKRYPEAVANYDRALTLQPDDQVSWQARVLASQQSGLAALKQPTTKPVWYGQDSGDSTFVENEVDSQEAGSLAIESTVNYHQPMLIIEDDAGQREIALDAAQYTIGRDPKNDICLRSQFASRYHAVLLRVEKNNCYTYKIVDGNLAGKPSTNGLLINGQKQQSSQLKTGDSIIFGPHVKATYQMPTLGLSD